MSKFDGLKVGDRVRITHEATVKQAADKDGGILVIYDGAGASDYVLGRVADRKTFQITVIEKPLAVGDAVVNTHCLGRSSVGKIEAILDFKGEPYAVVSGFGDGLGTSRLSDYARAK